MLLQIKNKRGQEEIVGFVLIVLIVSIALIILLGIFLRGNNKSSENPEISQFLDSLSEITTECSVKGGYSYLNYADLVEKCNEGGLCHNNRKTCDILKETSRMAVENSWNFGPESEMKGYRLNITFTSDNGRSEDIPDLGTIEGGKCQSSFVGDERTFLARGGKITLSLDICL